MYFEQLPFIPYPVNGEFRVLRDITLNIRFKKDIINNIALSSEYDIEDHDTPEIIAEKLYGNPNLYWILMLYNEQYDYINDFPIPNHMLAGYIDKKYGEGKTYDQHRILGALHYRTPEGYDVDPDFPRARPVTNYEYEFGINESKRRIKVIDPRLVEQIVAEAESLYNA